MFAALHVRGGGAEKGTGEQDQEGLSEQISRVRGVSAAAEILLVNDEGGGFGDELAQAVLAIGAFLDRWSTFLGSPP